MDWSAIAANVISTVLSAVVIGVPVWLWKQLSVRPKHRRRKKRHAEGRAIGIRS